MCAGGRQRTTNLTADRLPRGKDGEALVDTQHDQLPRFAWSSPTYSFSLASHATAVAPRLSAINQINAAKEMMFRGPSGTRLAGALPFDLRESGALFTGFAERLEIKPQAPALSTELRLEESPQSSFEEIVRRGLTQIRRGMIEKVVLSRRVMAHSSEVIDVWRAFERISIDPSVSGFLVVTPQGALVGASPEVLMKKTGPRITSRPLAGSAARSFNPITDAQNAADLLASEKSMQEHRIVVDDIASRLRVVASDVQATSPFLTSTDTIWHLATEISATVGLDVDSLDLVRILHPTPAVGGSPRAEAQELIRELEGDSRSFYTGAAGWQDQNGDGEWRVTLRCAMVEKSNAVLYAGAGIVYDSIPEQEYLETGVKLRPMLDALGIRDR